MNPTTMNKGGWSTSRLARMHDVLATHVDSDRVPGLVALVSRRGETHVDAIGAKSLGDGDPMRRNTLFRIASMTKPVITAATLLLVERCKLRLDQSVDDLLPELANRRVLRSIDAELDDTTHAERAITVRDLLTFRMGFGSVMAPPGTYPIQRAIAELQLGGDGPPIPSRTPPPDEWMRRLGSLPLMFQPGEKWLYHTSADVLGVLIERVSRQSLESFLSEHFFGPLGMNDTAFSVRPDQVGRLAGSYRFDRDSGRFVVYDAADRSDWSRPPAFQSGGGGLVSTVDDYLAFSQMLLHQGRHGQARILSRLSIELMTTDQLTERQRADASMFFREHSSWGMGVSVGIKRTSLYRVPGRFGWDGGLGTSGYIDPREHLVGILMTQRMMDSPEPPQVFEDFWTSAYGAVDD